VGHRGLRDNVNATWARVPAGSSNADTLADAGVNLIVVKNGAS
jgi:hypothetical protein